MSVTVVAPAAWKVAAARTRIAALISIARSRARLLSQAAIRAASCPARIIQVKAAGLHDRGVEIEIVRHDRRAEDADGQIEHARVGDERAARDKARRDLAPDRTRQRDLDGKAGADQDQQANDHGFQPSEASPRARPAPA
jgi:hypothetical protein